MCKRNYNTHINHREWEEIPFKEYRNLPIRSTSLSFRNLPCLFNNFALKSSLTSLYPKNRYMEI